jgi:hypothetical protein
MATSVKISQLPEKGANLEATDLLEVSEFNGTGYVSKSITGQEIIDSVTGGGVTNITTNAPLSTTGGTTPDLAISEADASTDGFITAVDWNTFNDKQDELVSGTNIKTINGSSVLGSGDLVVSGGGGGFHIPIKPRSGAGYSNNIISGSGTFGNSGSVLYLTPLIPANSLTISSASIQVTTAGAGTNMKIVVYSDVNGLPTTKLLESSLLDISTTGFKTFTTSFTFNAGTTYWIGTIASLGAGAITSTSQSLQIGTATNSNTTFNGFSQAGVNILLIPTTLSLTSANLQSISSLPRVTFISA